MPRDLDRRKEKVKSFASRLERMAAGHAKERVRALRLMTVSAFSSGKILDTLEGEIETLEQENGIEIADGAGRITLFYFKASQIDKRLVALEQSSNSHEGDQN